MPAVSQHAVAARVEHVLDPPSKVLHTWDEVHLGENQVDHRYTEGQCHLVHNFCCHCYSDD